MRPIRGERTTLRPVEPDDLDLLAGWLADPEIYRWWGGSAIPREEVAEKYIGRRPDVFGFIVEADGGAAAEPADRRPIGYLQYWIGEGAGGPGTEGGIDMYLVPNARQRGFGPDAARAVVRYLIEALGWRRVTVDPAADNARAIRAWERAGFAYERDWPDHPDGPAVLLAIEAAPAPAAGPDPSGEDAAEGGADATGDLPHRR